MRPTAAVLGLGWRLGEVETELKPEAVVEESRMLIFQCGF